MSFEIVHAFESAAFAGVTIEVGRVNIREGLNECYRVVVDLEHPDRDADLTKLLGKDGTLTIGRAGRPRHCRIGMTTCPGIGAVRIGRSVEIFFFDGGRIPQAGLGGCGLYLTGSLIRLPL